MALDGISGPPRVEPMVRPTTLDREREQDRNREGDQNTAKQRQVVPLREREGVSKAQEADALQLTDAAIERSIESMEQAKRIANRVTYQIKRSPERAIEAQGAKINESRALDLTI